MNFFTPTASGVAGVKPTASWSASMLAKVAGTSPCCIGKKFFSAVFPRFSSTRRMSSMSSTGLLLPML
jgi:hypothetical protein